MGTNFYATGRESETLHIGKSSVGWKFLHRAYPDLPDPLNTWEQWEELLSESGVRIEDEYGNTKSLDELGLYVDVHYRIPHRKTHKDAYHDPEGRDFYAGEFS